MPNIQPPIPILMYHQITEPPPKGMPYRDLCVSPDAFARQMSLIKKMGYMGLSMGHLMPYLQGKKIGKVIGLTFDDGYVNNLTHALPVLSRHGFSSTCYAVGGLLGQTNRWDEKVGIAQVPLMTAADLRLWLQAGQEVGAHTFNHIDLLAESNEASRADMAQCKSVLEAATGVEQLHFCYPYGRYAHAHTVMARQAGFQTATTTRPGRCQPKDDLFELPRIEVGNSTTLAALCMKIATPYEDFRGKRELERQTEREAQHS